MFELFLTYIFSPFYFLYFFKKEVSGYYLLYTNEQDNMIFFAVELPRYLPSRTAALGPISLFITWFWVTAVGFKSVMLLVPFKKINIVKRL